MTELSTRNREADMRVLAELFFKNLVRERQMEYGGWGLDDKRPFGNSDVDGDMCEALELERNNKSKEYARDLYNNLGPWLKTEWMNLMQIADKHEPHRYIADERHIYIKKRREGTITPAETERLQEIEEEMDLR